MITPKKRKTDRNFSSLMDPNLSSFKRYLILEYKWVVKDFLSPQLSLIVWFSNVTQNILLKNSKFNATIWDKNKKVRY